MSNEIIQLSDSNFDAEVLKKSGLILVDFWAEWCGPCRMIAPILHEIAVEYAGRLIVAKLNVDENQGISQKYGIRSIPTLLLFQDGEKVDTKVGALSKADIKSFVDSKLWMAGC